MKSYNALLSNVVKVQTWNTTLLLAEQICDSQGKLSCNPLLFYVSQSCQVFITMGFVDQCGCLDVNQDQNSLQGVYKFDIGWHFLLEQIWQFAAY